VLCWTSDLEIFFRDVKVRGSLGCLERTGKKQNQDHSPGVQESRPWPVQRPAWKNPMGDSPGGKSGPGEPIDIQGSPPPNSRLMHSNVQEIKQRCQEASTDE